MGGYGYTWRRDLNAIEPEQYAHGSDEGEDFLSSPFNHLIQRARGGEANPSMRRRLGAGADQRDFPVLEEFFAKGATDYVAQLFIYGEDGDRSQGSGIVYSFATDRKGGFSEDDTTLLQATLPALSLAMKAHAAHVIASGLLGTYLGEDAGRRVHAGAVTRGSVEKLSAVIWYADIRGFTPISDAAPGAVIVDLLNDVFEIMTASLRPRGGQVLKFIGDGMLATFSFEEADRAETCRRALDAAIEAMQQLGALNTIRAAAGVPVASVDLALHIGEVLYGNVGASDRLDFTVIGPAVNEVGPHRGVVRAARPLRSRLAGVRRRRHRRRRPPPVPRAPRAARSQGAEGDIRAGPGRRASLPSPRRTRSTNSAPHVDERSKRGSVLFPFVSFLVKFLSQMSNSRDGRSNCGPIQVAAGAAPRMAVTWMKIESGWTPGWLSGATSSAISEILYRSSSSVGASAAARISSQCPLHTFASASQIADTVKITGFVMATSLVAPRSI